MADDRIELLRSAARCYQQIERLDDACRCFELAGDDAVVGRLHAQGGRHARAVSAFLRAGLWQEAAKSYLQLGQYREAADCLLSTGQTLRAAWIFADGAGEPSRARDLLRISGVATETQALAVAVVEARCDAAHPTRRRSAARRLWEVVEAIESENGAIHGRDLREWSIATAAALHRPDLQARLHAAAFRARVPGALKQWERWALEHHGNAEGLPRENDFVAGEEH